VLAFHLSVKSVKSLAPFRVIRVATDGSVPVDPMRKKIAPFRQLFLSRYGLAAAGLISQTARMIAAIGPTAMIRLSV
jgi:hypothetical protein